jgi:hypothetical protein
MAARSDFVTWVRGKLRWAAGLSVDGDIQVIFSVVEVAYEWCIKGHRNGGFYTGKELTRCKICRLGDLNGPNSCLLHSRLVARILPVERFRSCCIE